MKGGAETALLTLSEQGDSATPLPNQTGVASFDNVFAQKKELMDALSSVSAVQQTVQAFLTQSRPTKQFKSEFVRSLQAIYQESTPQARGLLDEAFPVAGFVDATKDGVKESAAKARSYYKKFSKRFANVDAPTNAELQGGMGCGCGTPGCKKKVRGGQARALTSGERADALAQRLLGLESLTPQQRNSPEYMKKLREDVDARIKEFREKPIEGPRFQRGAPLSQEALARAIPETQKLGRFSRARVEATKEEQQRLISEGKNPLDKINRLFRPGTAPKSISSQSMFGKPSNKLTGDEKNQLARARAQEYNRALSALPAEEAKMIQEASKSALQTRKAITAETGIKAQEAEKSNILGSMEAFREQVAAAERSNNTPMAKFMRGLVKGSDFIFDNLAPMMGAPGVVLATAYKNLAGYNIPDSKYYRRPAAEIIKDTLRDVAELGAAKAFSAATSALKGVKGVSAVSKEADRLAKLPSVKPTDLKLPPVVPRAPPAAIAPSARPLAIKDIPRAPPARPSATSGLDEKLDDVIPMAVPARAPPALPRRVAPKRGREGEELVAPSSRRARTGQAPESAPLPPSAPASALQAPAGRLAKTGTRASPQEGVALAGRPRRLPGELEVTSTGRQRLRGPYEPEAPLMYEPTRLPSVAMPGSAPLRRGVRGVQSAQPLATPSRLDGAIVPYRPSIGSTISAPMRPGMIPRAGAPSASAPSLAVPSMPSTSATRYARRLAQRTPQTLSAPSAPPALGSTTGVAPRGLPQTSGVPQMTPAPTPATARLSALERLRQQRTDYAVSHRGVDPGTTYTVAGRGKKDDEHEEHIEAAKEAMMEGASLADAIDALVDVYKISRKHAQQMARIAAKELEEEEEAPETLVKMKGKGDTPARPIVAREPSAPKRKRGEEPKRRPAEPTPTMKDILYREKHGKFPAEFRRKVEDYKERMRALKERLAFDDE